MVASSTTGSAQGHTRANTLDTLRLILASLVVLEHANNLFHVANDDPSRFGFFLFNMSGVAVSAFFLVSGMLTYISYQRDSDLMRFYLRRFFRIFPAYWTVIALQIVIFAALFGPLVNWDRLPLYAVANITTANFIAPTFLDGVPALNGSLWTIKIEASYYAVLPFIFFLLIKRQWLVACGFGGWLFGLGFVFPQ